MLVADLAGEAPQLRCREPVTVPPLGTSVLERDVQTSAESRMLVEETAHADGHLGLAVRTRRIIEDYREPPLAGWIPVGVAEHGDGFAFSAVHDCERRPAVLTVRLAHLLPRNREGAARLQAACSGPPGLSPSGCPKSQRCPSRMKPPTISPSTRSRNLQASPRAQRTRPVATAGFNALRPRRCDGRAYFALMAAGFARALQRFEQKRWFSARAW